MGRAPFSISETGWLGNPRPGLRGRFAPPLGAFPSRAAKRGLEGGPPVRKTTSAAYTVGQQSVAEAVAAGCPARFSSRRLWHGEDLPGEEIHARHARPGGELSGSKGVLSDSGGKPGIALN
jgi:hypothetical protein